MLFRSLGSDEDWEMATAGLRDSLEMHNLKFKVNEGDGAFYGPKIDFHLRDCLGRTWQCGTIQLDIQMPERFDLNYIGADGEKHRPIMIHRTIYGSIERFMGILIEQYAGAFPAWLAPVQVKLMNITDDQADYVNKIAEELKENGFRVETDLRNEKIGYKIRAAMLEKIPYMLVVGDKEMTEEKISIRSRKGGDLGKMDLKEFMLKLGKEVEEKINDN